MENVAALIEDERQESFTSRQVLAHADRHLGRLTQSFPRIGVVHSQRILEPNRLRRFDGLSDLDRRPQVIFPVTMPHDVVIPSDGLPTIIKTLLNTNQLLGGQYPIGDVAR